MVITFDNIFSGLVGAIVGVSASFALSWFNRRRDSRLALSEVLFEMRHTCYYDVLLNQKDESAQLLRQRYIEAKKLSFAVLQWCYPWERSRMIKAWNIFKGPKTSQHVEIDYMYDTVRDWKELHARTEPLLIFLKA